MEKVLLLNHAGKIATLNHYQYDPYLYDEDRRVYIIDLVWFSSLLPFTRDLIREAIPAEQFTLGVVPIPHPPSRRSRTYKIYQAYVSSYDYDWYAGVMSGVQLVVLSPEEKEMLAKITEERLTGDGSLTDQHQRQLRKLKSRMKPYMRAEGKPWFVRLSSTSSKKDEPPFLIGNENTLVNYLTRSFSFLSQEYLNRKRTSIVLVPWSWSLKSRNEFRVFVCRGSVTAISQSRYGRSMKYTAQEMHTISRAASELEWSILPYNNLVADVQVDFLSGKAYLIECNPFGAFGPSSSALFDWIDDYAILYGYAPPQLRVVGQ